MIQIHCYLDWCHIYSFFSALVCRFILEVLLRNVISLRVCEFLKLFIDLELDVDIHIIFILEAYSS